MARNRDLSKLLSTANGKIGGSNLDVSFENISDTGTEGTKVASGTTAQRGSTAGQFRYNSTTGKFEGRNSSGFVSIEVTPVVSSVNVSNITQKQINDGFDLVITGQNFATGDVVKFIANDNTEFTAPTTTINSSTQITARVTSNIDATKEPYKISVTSSGGLTGSLASAFNIDAAPSWSTAAGNLGSITEGNSVNVSATATDPESDTIAYTETGGTVLSTNSLTLNSSTGAITGTAPSVSSDTTLSFNLRATSGTNTTDRAFNIIIVNPDGTSRSKAIVVAKTENPVTKILSTRNESSGSITEGVYWFKSTNTADEVYVFPTVLRNFNSATWLMITKNFRPHAYKGTDSDSNTSGGNSTANNSAHELSYGLIASDGSALVTNANVLGTAANTSPSASTLGTYHCAVGIKSFGDNVWTQTAFHGRDGSTRYLTRSDLTDKIHKGQNPAQGQYEDNTWYSPSSGSGYMYFNTRMTASDMDTMRLGLTPRNSVNHDYYNNNSEHTGTTWFRDGNDGYTTDNRDTQLSGSSNDQYGRISIWVK